MRATKYMATGVIDNRNKEEKEKRKSGKWTLRREADGRERGK